MHFVTSDRGNNPGKVFVSHDYGDTFQDESELFKINETSFAYITDCVVHPTYRNNVSIINNNGNVV